MSFLTSWFRKKNEDDYETILSELAHDIGKRQVKLSEIRLRERRATLLTTMYTLAAWVAYVGLWYASILPGRSSSGIERALRGVPVVLGPIVILFIRRIVQIWYARIGNAEEKTLQQLLKQQRTKVEEIKKKTNYYSTRDLLQRYDEQGTPSNTPVRPRGPTQPQQPLTPTPIRIVQPGQPNSQMQTPISKNLQAQLSPIALSPPGPPRKQWFDKIADAVLGDEDSARFALICEKCFAHNGLVKESVWEDTQYVCPNCKHFNPSRRSKKEGTKQPTPSPQGSRLRPIPLSPQPQSPPQPQPKGSPQKGDESMMDVVED